MTKTTSIVLLCIVTVIVLFLGVFSFIPDFEYGEYGVYHSPLNLIQKSMVFTDSVKATYQVALDDGTESFDNAAKILARRFEQAAGYYGVDISFADGVATIVLPKTANENKSTADHILEHLTQKGKVEILSTSYDSGATYSEDSVVLTQEHFRRARVQSYLNDDTTLYVCRVKLTSDGEKLANESFTSGTPYVCAVDGEIHTWMYFSGNELQITFAGTDESRESSEILASFINNGALDATLTLDTSDEIVGGNHWIFFAIFGALVVASWCVLIVRYRLLGFAGAVTQTLAVIIFTLFASLVHLEIFNVGAAIATVLVYAFMTVFTCLMFEKIYHNKESQSKNYAWLRKNAFANVWKINLIAHAILLVVGIILWVIPTAVTAPVGNVFVYGSILSLVVTLLINSLCAIIVTPLEEDHFGVRKVAAKK